jgi:pimeloyl-ACP methyl ester carboxylesterase
MRLRVPPAVLTRTLAWLAVPRPATSRALLRLMSEPGADVEDLVDWMTVVSRHVRTSLAPRPLPAHVLRQVTSPVLVLAGEHDPFLPGRRLAAAARQRLPSAQTTVVSGGSHLLPHDQPAHVTALLTQFLEGPEQP